MSGWACCQRSLPPHTPSRWNLPSQSYRTLSPRHCQDHGAPIWNNPKVLRESPKVVNSQKWPGEGKRGCTSAKWGCTGQNGFWMVQKTLGRFLLPELKLPFAPSPNHFWEFTTFGLSPRTFGLQNNGSFMLSEPLNGDWRYYLSDCVLNGLPSTWRLGLRYPPWPLPKHRARNPPERSSCEMFARDRRRMRRNFGDFFCCRFLSFNFQGKWPQNNSQKILDIFHSAPN